MKIGCDFIVKKYTEFKNTHLLKLNYNDIISSNQKIIIKGGCMSELLNLEYNQQISIENTTYTVIAMLKFVEGSSYWLEYILRNNENSEQAYLDVEPIGKYAIHKMLKTDLNLDLQISYDSQIYKLFQKGQATVEAFWGFADVSLKEKVEYYEYSTGNGKLLTIEKWGGTKECSCGKYIEKNKIKILKIKDDSFRL